MPHAVPTDQRSGMPARRYDAEQRNSKWDKHGGGLVEDIKPLIFEHKDMLVKLFDDLEVAHYRMARVCGRLSSLLEVLNTPQLMIVLKATVRPMVQLNAVKNFLNTTMMTKRRVDLPDDQGE